MLNSKLQQLRDHFGVFQVSDWQAVEPAWILNLDGIGPKTLDYIRLLLAHRGLTLKGDKTPEFWRKHLGEVQICDQLGDLDDGDDRGVMAPFVVLVDTAEQEPYTFQGMRGDAEQQGRPLIVPTEQRALGRHPDSLGDYSLDCGVGRCHVERKSMADAHGTILGFRSGRRDRFEKELQNLSEMSASVVVVECSYTDLIRLAPQTDHRDPQANAKILFRSIVSFQQEFRVPWHFAEDRRLAEQFTFRWLWRFAEKQREAEKARDKELRRVAKLPAPSPVNMPEPASVASLFE